MESSVLVFLVPAATLIGVAIIVKAIIDSWTKMRCREMGPVKSEPDGTIGPRDTHAEMKRLLASLKWSLILIGIGFPPALSYVCDTLPTGVILGLMLVFAGFGLFIYFLLARSMLDKMLGKKNEND